MHMSCANRSYYTLYNAQLGSQAFSAFCARESTKRMGGLGSLFLMTNSIFCPRWCNPDAAWLKLRAVLLPGNKAPHRSQHSSWLLFSLWTSCSSSWTRLCKTSSTNHICQRQLEKKPSALLRASEFDTDFLDLGSTIYSWRVLQLLIQPTPLPNHLLGVGNGECHFLNLR